MFDTALFWVSFKKILGAVPVTLEITLTSAVLGLLLAGVFYFVRAHFPRSLGLIAFGFGFFFRGTPLLLQLFLIYFGMGQFSDQLEAWHLWDYFRDPLFCAILTLTLNTASYSTEIVRSAALSLRSADWESGAALGLSKTQVFYHIQARKFLRVFMPAYTNEFILLLKASSLCSTITVAEMMDVTKSLLSETYAPLEVFAASGLVYFLLIFAVSRLFIGGLRYAKMTSA